MENSTRSNINDDIVENIDLIEVSFQSLEYYNKLILQIIILNATLFGVIVFNFLDTNFLNSLNYKFATSGLLITAAIAQIFSLIMSIFLAAIFITLKKLMDILSLSNFAAFKKNLQNIEQQNEKINITQKEVAEAMTNGHTLLNELKNITITDPEITISNDLVNKLFARKTNMDFLLNQYSELINELSLFSNKLQKQTSLIYLNIEDFFKKEKSYKFFVGIVIALVSSSLIFYLIAFIILIFQKLYS